MLTRYVNFKIYNLFKQTKQKNKRVFCVISDKNTTNYKN